jgi:hypothetical protein
MNFAPSGVGKESRSNQLLDPRPQRRSINQPDHNVSFRSTQTTMVASGIVLFCSGEPVGTVMAV